MIEYNKAQAKLNLMATQFAKAVLSEQDTQKALVALTKSAVAYTKECARLVNRTVPEYLDGVSRSTALDALDEGEVIRSEGWRER